MERILIDFAAEKGAVKPLHAVNNCPIRPMSSQCWGNFDIWPEMGAPYGRTHDTAHEYHYGLNHVIDISGIFPDFDADESDPASYDFLLTDKLIADTYACGTEIFYRLGESIDHRVKKYHVNPPKDYAKWARIAEHIIRHYTEGWADGFRYKMTYWRSGTSRKTRPSAGRVRKSSSGTSLRWPQSISRPASPTYRSAAPPLAALRITPQDSLRKCTAATFPWTFSPGTATAAHRRKCLRG